MNVAFQRNIGSFIKGAAGLGASTITAGGAGDNTAIEGLTVDRNAFDPLLLSGAFIVQYSASLNVGGGETVAGSCVFEDSADGVVWATYDGGPGTNTVTISADGAGVATFKCQLGGARRYVRAKPTFNMSAAGTDTLSVLGGVWVLGGADELPITDAPASGVSA